MWSLLSLPPQILQQHQSNNIINAVKGRNAIIVSPSPSGSKVFEALLKCINTELDKINAPKDLIQSLPSPISIDLTKELMKQVDLVIVTGAQNNVRQAYSSGNTFHWCWTRKRYCDC